VAKGSVRRVSTVNSPEEAIAAIVDEAHDGDVVCCIALGGFDQIARRLVAALAQQPERDAG
jgi:hypothetical protein